MYKFNMLLSESRNISAPSANLRNILQFAVIGQINECLILHTGIDEIVIFKLQWNRVIILEVFTKKHILSFPLLSRRCMRDRKPEIYVFQPKFYLHLKSSS